MAMFVRTGTVNYTASTMQNIFCIPLGAEAKLRVTYSIVSSGLKKPTEKNHGKHFIG